MLVLIIFNIAFAAGSVPYYSQVKQKNQSMSSSVQLVNIAELDAGFGKRPCKPVRHSWYPCFDPCHSGNCYYAHCITLFALHVEDSNSSANEEILIIRNTKRTDPDLSLEKRPPRNS